MTLTCIAALWLLVPSLAAATADTNTIRSYALHWFPDADDVTPVRGDPPAAEVSAAGLTLGYVFLTDQVSPIPAYSGKPLTVLVGMDTSGVIRGVGLLAHQEPILVTGVTDQRLAEFLQQYPGTSATDKVQVGGSREGFQSLDGISGATITVSILNASVMNSARKITQSRGLHKPAVPREEPAPPDVAAVAAGTTEPDFAPIESGTLWREAWAERKWQIVLLVVGLVILTAIVLFQDALARRPALLGGLRTAFLLYTAIFIGVYAMAQLSVVHVLTFTQAILSEFHWSTFLMDPMLFILWSFVAVVLLFWGRGVFCGWLCPYGALQELINDAARRFRVPQRVFPPAVHDRLWALKYVILLALVGVSMQSLADAERLAEVEPFKTAITLRFQRDWGYVLYATGLLMISAVNRKFFCKYLCPLGAALAIPARLKLFDWLKRHKECGHPCQICAVDCEVQAIDTLGRINPNECHYCLDCQVTYFDDRRCPPMVGRRKRREQGHRARQVLADAGTPLPAVDVRDPNPSHAAKSATLHES